MDFVTLQRLNYDLGISCEHGDSAPIIADGLTLGHALHRAHFVVPWKAPDSQQMTCGSLFSARVAISSKGIRERVLQFADKGLQQDEHEQLVSDLQALPASCTLEHALLPFVRNIDDSPVCCCPTSSCRQMLKIVGTTAPVCHLTQGGRALSVLTRIAAGTAVSVSDQLEVSRHSPAMHGFLRMHLAGGALPVDVQCLLEALLQVISALLSRPLHSAPPFHELIAGLLQHI